MRVLLLESVHEEAQARLDAAVELVRATALDAETVAREAAGCAAIITRGAGRIPVSVMDANPGLRCVARCGVGLDNIDLEAATRLGIPVVHAPDSCTQSVAEHTLGMMLALSRRFVPLDRAVKAGDWGAREGFRGLELAGKTLGVVGLGRIGTRTAELAQTIGMKVVTWSPHRRDERFAAVPLEELLATADVVSLHLALTPATRGLIDRAALRRMKPGAVLVNTARGALVDEAALAKALMEGLLAGAGLDVMEEEPPPPDHPLLRQENVLISPHTAALTDTAYRWMCVETVEQVLRILVDEAPDPRNVFNHSALALRSDGRSEGAIRQRPSTSKSTSKSRSKSRSDLTLTPTLTRTRPVAPPSYTRCADYVQMLQVAIEEARAGLAEGGIPIGAVLFDRDGNVLGRGHNRRVQEDDPSVHGETDAFRNAGRQRGYRDKIMVTTLAPCWYCSGLIRQFQIGTVVVGESATFRGGIDWLRELGVEVIDLDSAECKQMLAGYIAAHPEVWNEDIGEA